MVKGLTPSLSRGLKFPFKDLHTKNLSAGLIAGILSVTGPTAMIMEASANGHFTQAQTSLWMFSVYVFGGIFGIILPLYYKIPISGGHTITGVAYLATVTAQFSYHELIGAYIFSGVLMLLIGFSGVFSKLMKIVPKEMIAAMLVGMIAKYMVNFIISVHDLLLVGSVSLIAFFIFHKRNSRIPPVIIAILLGFIILLLTHSITPSEISKGFIFPQFQVPEFNPVSFISVSVPLALLILSNDAAVGIGALGQKDFRPPVNKIISFCGIFSILSGFFGGQSANMAGMATAICSDEETGQKDKRYMGAVVSGIIVLLFGIFSWKLTIFIQALPSQFISILVGFSLLNVFASNLHNSFSKPNLKISTALTFIIAASNITIFHISAPVWSLLIGTLIAIYIEKYESPAILEKKAG
ncbi:benzoate/H(+) symporter BenE family transporter [Neobacillus mesonae]|uniref:benzoate/H(+) symporter BenE family transporter n=1 Tax=Neobacillus mesonae TaxID=1193713 RepID=UPI00203D8C00|nr:benzoate/H(+) symporter BenE family transporter [Neobacillus mesonae]MCM3571009.1 benzoate/H(+) symporter BenE family transporter [Neobacillus mesonae]